jgi:hypothetical protein
MSKFPLTLTFLVFQTQRLFPEFMPISELRETLTTLKMLGVLMALTSITPPYLKAIDTDYESAIALAWAKVIK